MGTYSDLEIQGTDRDLRLVAIQQQLAEWELVMPPVAPIMLHFGLHDFDHVGETEFWIANEVDAGYCGKYLFLFDGQSCPFHRHQRKHETFFVVKGSIRMCTDQDERLLRAGEVLVMPPGVGHTFSGVGAALVLEVSMPSLLQDNFFADSRIGDNGVI